MPDRVQQQMPGFFLNQGFRKFHGGFGKKRVYYFILQTTILISVRFLNKLFLICSRKLASDSILIF